MKLTASTLFGDQLLVSVFAPYAGYTFEIINESEIIAAFYEADDTGRFNELFTNYPFDTDGIMVKSSALEEAIDSMQQTRLLGRENPDLKHYKIMPAVKIRYEKFISGNLDRTTKQKLKDLSELIEQKLKLQKPE